MVAKLSEVEVLDFMDELAMDNPVPEEPWRAMDDFDPPWPMKTLREMARHKLIEFDAMATPYRFRFTAHGREIHHRLKAGTLLDTVTEADIDFVEGCE